MSERKAPNDRQHKRKRTRSEADRAYDAEAAYELTAAAPVTPSNRSALETKESHSQLSGIGFLAAMFAVISLFFTPIIMGPTSAALGIIAYIQGNRYAGIFAIVLGIAAFVIRLLAAVI